MHISSFGLHVTDQCNARCQHCAYHCGPEVIGVMSLDDASEYLRQVANRQPLELVCISGGEPCLHFNLVVCIVREAQALGASSIWVFTNAFWAVNRTAAINRLTHLKEAGMTRLCLSADSFHQAFIPAVRVRHAIDAARNLGLELVLDTRFLGPPRQDNPTNRATQEVLTRLGALEGIELWQGEPLYIGRAADTLLPELVQHPRIPDGRCPGPWAGGTWKNPVGIDVDLYGEVTLCPGLSIGNAKQRPLAQILDEYRPRRHPIIRELVTGGPAALAERAQQLGYVPKAGYASKCHLCYDVRKFLRVRYAQELTPPICYDEATLAKT